MAQAPETVWEIPEPLSTHEVHLDDGAGITLRRHGNPAGPRIILSHGNGLAIDLYYPFWSLLTKDFDLVMYDLRSHGWNSVDALENHNIPTFISDHDRIIEAIDQRYGKKPKVGVYHSVSALASLLSPTGGGEYSALVLFDPPLCKPGSTLQEFDESVVRTSAIIRRRASRFETREQLIDLFSFLPLFSRAVPGVLDLVSKTTLRKSENESGYELRCPADYEAQILEYLTIFALSVDFGALHCPTKVIGADPTSGFAYLPSLELSDFVGVDYDFLPEATHLMQLEKPGECVAMMRQFLEQIGLI